MLLRLAREGKQDLLRRPIERFHVVELAQELMDVERDLLHRDLLFATQIFLAVGPRTLRRRRRAARGARDVRGGARVGLLDHLGIGVAVVIRSAALF